MKNWRDFPDFDVRYYGQTTKPTKRDCQETLQAIAAAPLILLYVYVVYRYWFPRDGAQ